MLRSIVVLTLAVALSGCSFLFLDKAPPPPVWDNVQWSDCTHSSFLPGIDTTIAVLNGLGTAILLSGNGSTSAIVGGVIDTLLYGASAMYGFKHTDRCRAFRLKKGVARSYLLPDTEAVAADRWWRARAEASAVLSLR